MLENNLDSILCSIKINQPFFDIFRSKRIANRTLIAIDTAAITASAIVADLYASSSGSRWDCSRSKKQPT